MCGASATCCCLTLASRPDLGDICRAGFGQFGCVQTVYDALQQANVDPTTGAAGSVCYAQGTTVQGNSTDGFADAVACVKVRTCGVVVWGFLNLTMCLAAVQASDVVIMVLGTDIKVEDEAHDRVDITLPGVQSQFASTVRRRHGIVAVVMHVAVHVVMYVRTSRGSLIAVAWPQIMAVGKPTVAVLLNGGVLAVPELKKSAGAIVEAFFPGVYGARAIADVVFGAYNPGGKLPVTMYQGDYVNEVAWAWC